MNPADIIERTQWDFFWIPSDASVVDRPEVLYVWCHRDARLLNCVTRTRAGAEQLPSLVEEVGRMHGSNTSRWLVRDGWWRRDLEEALTRASYRPVYEHGAYAMAVDELVEGESHDVRHVRDMAGLKDFYAVADAVFGETGTRPEQEMKQFLLQCTEPGARVHRFVAYEGDVPVSCGGLTSFESLRFGYLWAGATLEELRGRGHYRTVLQARLSHARRLGLESVGLYARLDTSAPIVERVGFRCFGEMSYWEREAGIPR